MSERDELADLATIIGEQFEHHPGPACSLCEDIKRAAAAVRVMGYRKPQQIATVEELAALYEMDRNVVIADEFGNAFQNLMGGWRCPGVDHFWSTAELHRKLGPDFTVLSIGGGE